MLALLKRTHPMIDRDEYGEFVFDKNGKDIIELLLVKMQGSVCYKDPKKSAAGVNTTEAGGAGDPAPKRRRVSQVKQQKELAFQAAIKMDTADGTMVRSLSFGDALLNTVLGQLHGLPEEALNMKATRTASQKMLSYMIFHKAIVGGIEYDKCCATLKAVFESLTSAHMEPLLKLHDQSLDGVIDSMKKSVFNAFETTEGPGEKNMNDADVDNQDVAEPNSGPNGMRLRAPQPKEILEDLIADQSWMFQMFQFQNDTLNSSRPLRFRPEFQTVVSSVLEACQVGTHRDVKLSIDDIAQVLAQHVSPEFEEKWCFFLSALHHAREIENNKRLSTKVELKDLSFGIFENEAPFSKLCSYRTTVVQSVLQHVAVGSTL